MPGPAVRSASTNRTILRERDIQFSHGLLRNLKESGLTDNHHFPLPPHIAYVANGMLQESKQLLYHYTDRAGFLGILRSENVWATAYDCLNDPQELVFAKVLLKGELWKRCEGAPGLRGLLAEIDALNFGDVYIASFSKTGDLGTQWQLYAKREGVSLGFPREIFEAAAQLRSGITIADVVYEPSQQVKLLAPVVDEACATASIAASAGELKRSFVERVAPKFRLVAPVIKNHGWSAEEEVRVIFTGSSWQAKTRTRGDQKVRYVTFPFKRFYKYARSVDLHFENNRVAPSSSMARLEQVAREFQKGYYRFGAVSFSGMAINWP